MKIRYMTIFLILLVCLVGAVSAADDVADDTLDVADGDAVAVDNVQEEVNEKVNEDVSTEPADTAADDTLQAQDNNDELKTGTKTVDVNNFTELRDAINDALSDAENDTYTINLNNGEYKTTTYAIFSTSSPIAKNIMIQGNNQTITSSSFITFNNIGSNILIKDVTFNSQLRVYASNMTFENAVLQKNVQVDQNSNLTLNNSTITKNLNVNEGKVVISDDCIFGQNALIILQNEEKSQIVINDIYKVVPYLKNFYDDYVIENAAFSFGGKQNYGKLTIKNSEIFSTNGGQFANYGTGELIIINSTITASLYNLNKITFINSTIKSTISNYLNYQNNNKKGTLNFTDDVIFGKGCVISGVDNVEIICNDINKILPFLDTYSGNYTLNNITISTQKTNNGNLTLVDVVLNARITNNGILTIGNNVTIGTNCEISGTGSVVTDNLSYVLPYMSTFYGEGIVSVNQLNYNLLNYGTLTFVDSTISRILSNYGTLNIINSTVSTSLSNSQGTLILKNITISNSISNNANCQLENCIVNASISNNGKLIISDDTIFGTKTLINGNGEIIINDTERVVDFLKTYNGNIVLTNKTINEAKINNGNLTLYNCTINAKIKNNGKIIIDDNTNFIGNAQIMGDGEIVTNNITRLLPYIQQYINGNHNINDVNFTKSYYFKGTVTLTNCNMTTLNFANYETLYLNNCTINVGEDNTFIINLGTIYVSEDTKITGKIDDYGGNVIYEHLPKTYTVTNNSVAFIFTGDGLNSIINPGDTLDFQGTIANVSGLYGLIIDKPVNIITSTNNGRIENFNSITFTKGASGSNVTGLHTYNTQIYVKNANNIVFDRISNVVEDKEIGSGVGVVSIRDNSSYITVKNSYFYTKDDGGHSTLVLAWADYCIIENNTIEGDGFIGNLLYLTTYNVENMPTDIVYNAHNKLINNRIRGPDTSMSICWGIVISGFDNLIDNNTIDYIGDGIMFQWGSGVDGIEQSECLFGSGENVVSNNKLYGGCGIRAGDIIYNNYMEGILYASNAIAYNNTANNLAIGGSSEVTNNTILNGVVFDDSASKSVLANNSIGGNISISTQATNNTISDNDIAGSIILDGSYNKLSNNKITTTEDYAVYSNKMGVNNTLTDNYLVANGKVGADAVSLRDPSNTIQDSTLATTIAVTAPSEATVNKTVKVTIKLMDANGNPITAQVTVTTSVGSETVNITNGEAVYQYTPTAVGQDTVTVKYAGNTSFYPTSNSANINVVSESEKQNQSGGKTPSKDSTKKPVIKISAKNKANVDYGFTYKVRVTSNGKSIGAGKQVTLKVGKTTLKAKTDKNGYATFTLAVKPATYTVTATYNKVSQKYKVTVKNVIQAKNLKVKKSAKKLKVKVTLKTSAKKPIKGKKVTIKINGKKITAKTNKKGLAKFTINKKILKKLKAGKKYKYQVIYGKDTVTKNLKVKK